MRKSEFFTDAELEIAHTWINPNWDTDYDYAGAVLLTEAISFGE